MWQRIQTLWLALAAICLFVLVFQDLAVFVSETTGSTYVLSSWQVREASTGNAVQASWPAGIASILSAFTSILSIFLYHRRMFQFRIVLINLFLSVGLLVYVGAISWLFCGQNDAGFSIKVWLALPIVAIILQYMASRRILFDEMLVRTSNRLR